MDEALTTPDYSERFLSTIAAFVTGDAAARGDEVELELTTRFGYALDFLRACGTYLTLPGRRFLEVGSGTGNVVTAAAALGAVTTATDTMAQCVEITRERIAEHGLAAQVFQHDIRSAPLAPDGAFDFVFCYQVLEHMPRRDQFIALGRLMDLVAEGGHLFIDTENALCPFDRHDTQLWLPRILRPEHQSALVRAFGKAIDYYEPSFGGTVELHDYLSYDEIVGAAGIKGFTVVNPFMPHRDGRQYARVVTGSDWLYDAILKYIAFERFSPVALLLRKG